MLKEIPPGCTVVGIPGRIVRRYGESTSDLNQVNLPDPVAVELESLRRRIKMLERKLDEQTKGAAQAEPEAMKDKEAGNDENI